jgi:hypothetical protein
MTAAFFANGLVAGGGMSLTQVFNATQVATSPLPDAAQSDPVFQRPSPNFNAEKSSPPAADSSPTKPFRSDTSRATTEPRDAYTSMKVPQDLRELQRLAEIELQRAREGEDWMDDPADKQAIQQAYLGRSISRKDAWTGGKGKPFVISSDAAYITPIRPYRQNTGKFIGTTDDIPEEDESDEASNDELSNPELLPQTSNDPIGRKPGAVMQVPMTSSRPDKTSSGNQSRSSPPDSPIPLGRSKLSQAVSAPRSQPRAPIGTPTVAIADSQPDIKDPESFLRPPPLAEPSSIDSNTRILQSQVTNRSRRATQLTGLDTSPVPRPHRDSSPIVHEDDEQVPSSPPVVYEEENHPNGVDGENDNLMTSDDELQLVGDTGVEHVEDDIDGPRSRATSPSIPGPPVKPTASQDPPIVQSSRERLQSTIPDSNADVSSDSAFDRPEPLTDEPPYPLSHPVINDAHTENETNSTGLYQSARSGFSASPQKKTQPSKKGSLSPTHTRLRTLTEIAADPDSQRSFESIDMDFHSGFEELDEYPDLVNPVEPVQPRLKKRKTTTYGNKRLGSPAKKTAKFLDDPVPELNEARKEETAVYNGPEETQLGGSPLKNVVRLSAEPTSDPKEPGEVADETLEVQTEEHLKSTPNQGRSGPAETPPSTRRREIAGALAATAARESVRFGKPAVPKKGKLTRPSKVVHTAGPGVRRLGSDLSKANIRSRPSEIPETPDVKSMEKVMKQAPEVPAMAIQDSVEPMEIDEPQVDVDDTDVTGLGDQETEPVEDVVDTLLIPRRVLALFRGSDIKYYPATCLGPSDGNHWKIRFDDGSIDTMLVSENFKTLDLQVGDQLKVDLPDMRKHTYVVVGFKDKIGTNEEEWPLTDRYGHQTVVLKAKAREGGPKVKSKTFKEVDVAVAHIYITQTMWKNFKNRHYKHVSGLSTTFEARFQTPPIASIPGTPLSRSRRETITALATSTHNRPSSVASWNATGVFANMAFALSFNDDEEQRDAISELVLKNGGRILEDHFEDLFQSSETTLSLTTEAASLGFVALISDAHSRRAKYFQALALNLPCLAARWVRDCVAQSSVVPFGRYLLPAGVSAFLGGAVRSRTMSLFDAAGPEGRLEQVVGRREKLFRGAMVVLVYGKSKKEKERCKTYTFLCKAHGAEKVVVVKDIDAARDLLEHETRKDHDEGDRGGVHNWVIVDGDKGGKAGIALFNRTEKRKRVSDASEDQAMVAAGVIGGRSVKVAGDEFVVQSLILGALCEG